MEEILRSLGLESLIDKFNENDIDEVAISLLGDRELQELIPKIGQRLKLKKFIDSLKRQELEVTKPQTGDSYIESDEDVIPEVKSAETNLGRISKIADEASNTGSIDGRAILKDGQSGGGLLKEGSRRKLSQLLIHHMLENRPSGKITTEEFYRLSAEIVEVFDKESVVVYYSAYLASTDETRKKNASGKLYESYITRRRKLRQSGELQGTSRASSSRSSSVSTPSTTSDDNGPTASLLTIIVLSPVDDKITKILTVRL